MDNLIAYIREQIATIIPSFDKAELKATISDSSYSIEFFVLINGERKQCYELVDDGAIDEGELDRTLALIAEYIRNGADYKNGTVNKLNFSIK